jgi:hypothetical protein
LLLFVQFFLFLSSSSSNLIPYVFCSYLATKLLELHQMNIKTIIRQF